MRYSKLLAAPVPIPPKSSEPVTLRFVEVPPNATSVPTPPATSRLSDANRKAGPLVASPKREVIPQPMTRPPGPRVAQRSAPSTPAPANSYSPPNETKSPAEPPLPDADISIGKPSGEKLAQSLDNLDRYIKGSSNGNGQSDNAGEGGEGNQPTGDVGSGVFFDTQGFDLGPWANRAVEIVRSNWLIPVAAELGMKGVVSIAFKVDKSGKILNIQVISPSGVPSFDQAAARALQASSPLPPLPKDFPRQVLPGVFRFYYNTPVPEK